MACVHSNFSCLKTSPTAAEVVLYMSVAVVVSLTVCGNLLVIISICHFKQLQTPTNFLLLSLATADFLVGLIVMPIFLIILIVPQWCFSSVVCTLSYIAALHLTCVSIYNVALISVDRCFALSNPFHYSMKMTVNVTLRMISILWLISFIYNMVFLYFSGNDANMKGNNTCSECVFTLNEVWSTVDFIIVFVVPCSMIIIIYLNIFAIAKQHANKIRSIKTSQKMNTRSMASERKAAKTLGVLVAAFLLCIVPNFLSSFFEEDITNGSAVTITMTLLYLNSLINPIIYALFYPWFQKSVKLILTLKICGIESSVWNVLEK